MKGVIKHLNSVDWRKKLQWSREALIEIKEEVADQTDLCEKHSARIKVLQEEQRIIQDQLEAVGTDWVDIDELKNNLLKKQNSLSVASSSLISGESKLKDLIGLKVRLRSFIEDFDNTTCEEQIEKHKGLLEDISTIERVIRSTKMEIANYQNKIDLLHDHEYDPDCEYCSNNQFVKEAEEAKTLIKQSKETLKRFEYDLELTNEKKDAINIAYLKAELEDYNLKFREVKTNEVQIQKIKAQNEANESKKALAEKEIEEVKAKITHYYENQEAYENLESLQRDLRAINVTIEKKEKEVERCNKKVLSLMSEEGATRRQIEEAREKIQQIDDAEKDYIAYDLFGQAMHANGVSYQVIKSMLPIINAEISSILNTLVGFEVFFDNVGDKLEIYIKHPKYDPRPLSMGSGAEKTIASMAIRLALISVTNLPKSELFILDEPATALDEEHMEGFIRLLQMIKGQFKTVLLISHLESLKDIVDMTIDIQKVGGYAKVKI